MSAVTVPFPRQSPSAPSQGATHPYRPDIDGLRGVAVLLVVLFHAVRDVFVGGFVGVDVFFVISGYLITSIIYRESRDGRFTLQDFYARRCRRILPALVVVLAATWTLGKLTLTANDFSVMGRHLIGGATFSSNFVLLRETGYFDIAAVRKPLLHLWSLAVEEQFYLVWPVLLTLILARGWQPLLITAGILLGSLTFAIQMVPTHSDLVFYMLPSRIWELLAGALLLLWQAQRGNRREPTTNRIAHEFRSVAGLLFIGVSCVVDSAGRARIGWLIIAVAGTALLISADRSLINKRLLSNRSLVLVGLISYPLYLWHWPLLSLTTLLSERATLAEVSLLKAAAVAASFLLAWCTWRFVELPARRFATVAGAGRVRRNRQVLLASATVLLIAGVVGWRSFNPRLEATREAIVDASEPLLNADAIFAGASYHRYSSAPAVVLLVGDSHANQYLPGLVPLAHQHGFGVSHLGFGGCLGVPLGERLWGTPEWFKRCESFADASFSFFLRDPAVKVMVFAARGELYAEGKEAGIVIAAEHNTQLPADRRERALFDAYSRAIGQAQQAGKRVVLTLDIPELDYNPEYCVGSSTMSVMADGKCVMSRRSVDERQRRYRGIVERLAREFPNLLVFDPIPLLCDSRWCYATRNGVLMYGNDNHLSVTGSRIVAERLADSVFGIAAK